MMDNSENRRFLVQPISKAFSEAIAEEEMVWIDAIPIKSWYHPRWGEISVTPDRAEKFVNSIKSKVQGQDLPIDYDHGLDPAKGGKAAGWIADARIENNHVRYGVKFTDTAKQEIKNGEWRYFSPEWYDRWKDNDGKEFSDVIFGGGLTNKPIIKGMNQLPVNFSELAATMTVDEMKEMEHSEPGSGGGGEPVPRLDEEDPTGVGNHPGSRRDSPPAAFEPENKEGEMDDETLAALRTELGLAEDADAVAVLASVKTLSEEIKPLRDAHKQFSERKTFSEQFPTEFQEMQRLTEKARDTDAKLFSETYARIVNPETSTPTGEGFSALVIEKLADVHKKFSVGSATVEDLADLLGAITNNGIVKYKEDGSSQRETVTNGADPRKAFSEKVTEVANADSLSWDKAVSVAAEKHPDLFRAYTEYRPSVVN